MKQPSLFDDQDTDAALPAATPAIPGSRRALNATQRRFNALLGQVDTLRQEYQRWQAFMDTYGRRVTSELVPEVAQLRGAQIALIRLFDAHVAQAALSKRDRAMVQELLIDMLEELLNEEETPELLALYELHAGIDQAQQDAQEFEMLRTMASILPVDVDAYTGEPNPGDFSEWINQQLDAQARPARGRKRGKRRAGTPELPQQPPTDDGSTTLRKMFRRLAGTLHPDRESDPEEQRRKTALMQELNSAYAAGDLLRILELQHTVDTRMADALYQLSEAELQPYIQLLQAQVKKAREEIDTLLAPLLAAFPGQTARSLTPTRVEKAVEQEIAAVRRTRRIVDADLQRFADVAALKEALAESRRGEKAGRQSRPSGRRNR